MQFPLPHSHWRHYKSTGGTDHTYEVIGIAKHSETSEDMVVYQALYEKTGQNPQSLRDSSFTKELYVRPLSMWYDMVDWNGRQLQRFIQI